MHKAEIGIGGNRCSENATFCKKTRSKNSKNEYTVRFVFFGISNKKRVAFLRPLRFLDFFGDNRYSAQLVVILSEYALHFLDAFFVFWVGQHVKGNF